MKLYHITLLLILLLINSTYETFGANLLTPFFKEDTTNTKTCYDCHNTLISQKIIHEPAKDACDNCHASNDKMHPQQGVKGFELADQPSALCFYCHEEYTKKNIHAPAESGECLSCHNVHSSNNEKLLTASSSNILCLQCHELDIPKEDVVHSPVKNGKCSSCHDPHQSDHNGFLKNTSPQLCFDCHSNVKEIATAKNIHAPFDEDCFTCHQPHSGKGNALLTEASPSLCFMCHGELEELVASATNVHKPMNDKKSCVNCHSPHGSNESTLLVKNEKDLCLSCHNKSYSSESGKIKNIQKKLAAGNNIHAPVEDACLNCHNPHAASQNSLLTNTFPKGSYVQKGEKRFGLCFDCHDESLLSAEKTNDATNFRHGDINMHYLHVNDDKGKNCNLCHDVHGSRNPYLINNKVLFGKWEMDMNFKQLENGGSCATGCHAEKKYDRAHIDSLNQNIADVVKPEVETGSRYDIYYENVHEIDSSVIIMNERLEAEYQRKQDSIKGIELLAEIAQDTNQVNEVNEDDTNLAVNIDEKDVEDTNTVEPNDTLQNNLVADAVLETGDTLIENNELDSVNNNELALNNSEDLESNDSNMIVASQQALDSNLIVDNAENENDTIINDLDANNELISQKQLDEEEPSANADTVILASVDVDNNDTPDNSEHISNTDEIQIKESIKEEETIVTTSFDFKNINFQFAKKTVDSNDKNILAVVTWLKANTDRRIYIHGYTDSIGADEYNYYLSLQRAESVRDLIVSKGINRKRLRIKGMADKNPIAPNNTPGGRALNRRVEFVLIED